MKESELRQRLIQEQYSNIPYEVDEDLEEYEDEIPFATKEETEQLAKAKNSPDEVRNSFIKYLRTEFGYGCDWTHPITGVVFKHSLIKEKLQEYMKYNEEYYSCLWALWTTRQSRAKIASYFHHSASTIKRRWKAAIDIIMIMLLYPELNANLLDLLKVY